MKAVLLALAATVAFAVTSSASPVRQIIGAEQDHSFAEVSDCAHFYKTTFTRFSAQVTDEERREIPLTGIDRLRVTASQEGGISIRGWHKPNARLIVCRSAAAPTRSQALRVLGAIEVSHAGGEIAARGMPNDDSHTWWVNMILYVPRRASVEVHASSGGVAIRNMAGHVTAHATSGGISIAQSSGNYKITTESGGITLDRITGEVEATSREGAIALKVQPADLPTIEAKTAAAGNILCTFKDCENGLGAWTSDRKSLRISGGIARIRLTTTGSQILISPVTY